MFVLAEFLFDFSFKNFSLFWPLSQWEVFETHSSTFLAFSLYMYQTQKRANRSFKGTESIFICCNGRKEYVKFSRILIALQVCLGSYAICHIDECGSQARERFKTPYK